MTTQPTLSTIEQALTILGEVYGREFTPPLIAVYERVLALIPDQTIERAALWLVQNHEAFTPTPAAFRAACLTVMTADEKEVFDGAAKLKTWLAAGVRPSGWSSTQYRWVYRALGLGEARQDDLDFLDRERARLSLPIVREGQVVHVGIDWTASDALPAGPVVTHLLQRYATDPECWQVSNGFDQEPTTPSGVNRRDEEDAPHSGPLVADSRHPGVAVATRSDGTRREDR